MNENTTTEGEKVDKERIAELRRMAYGCMGGRMYPQPIMDELLDALEAALARAEGADGGVPQLHRTEMRWMNVTPDEGLPIRILEAYIDSGFCTDNTFGADPKKPLCIAMNEAQEDRNKILRKAIFSLSSVATTIPQSDVPDRAAWLTIEEMANALVLEFGTPLTAARGLAQAIANASKAKAALRASSEPRP